MSGYSGTPLVKKLGIKADDRVRLLHAPDTLMSALELPAGVALTRRRGSRPQDVILYFTVSREALEADLPGLRASMKPACGLWVCWPKRASKRPTDMTEDVVRAVALPTGLVDNKVCSIDDTWSGLRLVIRKELR